MFGDKQILRSGLTFRAVRNITLVPETVLGIYPVFDLNSIVLYLWFSEFMRTALNKNFYKSLLDNLDCDLKKYLHSYLLLVYVWLKYDLYSVNQFIRKATSKT